MGCPVNIQKGHVSAYNNTSGPSQSRETVPIIHSFCRSRRREMMMCAPMWGQCPQLDGRMSSSRICLYFTLTYPAAGDSRPQSSGAPTGALSRLIVSQVNFSWLLSRYGSSRAVNLKGWGTACPGRRGTRRRRPQPTRRSHPLRTGLTTGWPSTCRWPGPPSWATGPSRPLQVSWYFWISAISQLFTSNINVLENNW